MAPLISRTLLPSARDTRLLVGKWVISLLVPLLVFTFLWNGEVATNQILIGFFMRNNPLGSRYDIPTLLGVTLFLLLLYAALTTLMGYAVAADSGKQNPFMLWISMLVFVVVPIFFVSLASDLFVGLSFSVLVWLPYFLITSLWKKFRPTAVVHMPERLRPLDTEQRAMLVLQATAGGFWFGTAFAVISLVIDLIYFFAGSYGTFGSFLLIWIVLRTVLLPFAGYFLGRLGGTLALRYTLKANGKNNSGQGAQNGEQAGKNPLLSRAFGRLFTSPAHAEVRNLVPNDLPLSSRGARNFYLLVLFAFLLFYPMLDPFFFGTGTLGRLAVYGDAGRYVILALGLNIVVGFAGLLDLGYVAFFVFGAYTWAMIGSPQLTVLTGLAFAPNVWPWLF